MNELAPVEYTHAPDGTMHLISQHPSDYQTLCGVIVNGKWKMGDETMRGLSATCLPCRSERAQRERNLRLGNEIAEEGCDRCVNCGCKYWENDRCVDCGADWSPEARGLDDD